MVCTGIVYRVSQCVVPFSVAIEFFRSVGTNCSVPWSSHRRWVPSKKTRRCYQYHRMLPPYATRGGSTGTLCDTTLFEVRATHTHTRVGITPAAADYACRFVISSAMADLAAA